MNVHEVPMIAFTVLAQMSAGAFIVLGVIHVYAAVSRRYSTAAADELSDSTLLAIGLSLVLGLLASMFHMNDVLHVLNVFRHLSSSWLSREIVAGILFAALGFLYTACQLLRLGSRALRQVLAVSTAAVGAVLVFVMSMVYVSLTTVPAWNTWLTTARFATTALLLGAFAVGTALISVVMLRRRGAFRGRLADRLDAGARRVGRAGLVDRLGGDELSPQGLRLMLASLRGIAVTGIVLLAVEFVLYALTIGRLASFGRIGEESLRPYVGAASLAWIVLTVLGAGLLGLFLYRLAGSSAASHFEVDAASGASGVRRPSAGRAERVAIVVTVAFALVLTSELLARAAFYESNIRLGM